MLKVGITGGIGAGKSLVSNIFNSLGIPVYNSDQRAKDLLIENQDVIAAIKSSFGEDLYEGNTINKALLASRVFGNKDAVAKLNSISHPAVFKDFDDWVLRQNSPYVLKEAALLFESGSYKTLDKMIFVSADLESRIERVIKRDNLSREQILNRIKHQIPEEEKERLSDFIIVNDGEQMLIPQVMKIHGEIKR